jgi:hypothetical protein
LKIRLEYAFLNTVMKLIPPNFFWPASLLGYRLKKNYPPVRYQKMCITDDQNRNSVFYFTT